MMTTMKTPSSSTMRPLPKHIWRHFKRCTTPSVMTRYCVTGDEEFFIYMPVISKSPPTPTPSRTPTPTATPTHVSLLTPLPSTYTPTPSATPLPGATGNIDIIHIFYDGTGQSEPDEYVEIRNADIVSIQMQGWTLRDNANHVFIFPNFVMASGQVCRVYTNQNHAMWCGFNYGSGSAIWNNSGDCAFLRNGSGTLVDQFCY
jgi:hypothetical protein